MSWSHYFAIGAAWAVVRVVSMMAAQVYLMRNGGDVDPDCRSGCGYVFVFVISGATWPIAAPWHLSHVGFVALIEALEKRSRRRTQRILDEVE